MVSLTLELSHVTGGRIGREPIQAVDDRFSDVRAEVSQIPPSVWRDVYAPRRWLHASRDRRPVRLPARQKLVVDAFHVRNHFPADIFQSTCLSSAVLLPRLFSPRLLSDGERFVVDARAHRGHIEWVVRVEVPVRIGQSGSVSVRLPREEIRPFDICVLQTSYDYRMTRCSAPKASVERPRRHPLAKGVSSRSVAHPTGGHGFPP